MKNRIFVSLIVGTIVTSIVLGATCVGFALDAKKKTGMLENMYERSFYSLCDSVNNLETDLSKLKVAVSDYESLPLMQSVYSHAATASESYAGLPIDSENETDCIKFFNQVSDWAASYAKSLSSTKSNGYKKQAGQLYEITKKLNDSLKQTSEKVEGKRLYAAVSEGLLPMGLENIDLGLRNVSIDYPSLIYDGPFADVNYEPKYIRNKREYSQAEAIRTVKELLDMKEVKCVGKSGGEIQSYELEGKVNGQEAFALVAVKGGLLQSFTTFGGKKIGQKFSKEQLAKRGEVFLDKCGYTRMQAVWYNELDDDVYINFAPVVDEVIYYTDLIKMRVSKYGEIEAIEATGYISMHDHRAYEVMVSEQEILQKVEDVTVKSVQMAVIPKDRKEYFCYEIYASKDGLDYYIYFDAESGVQVDVLRVVDTKQGKKAI